MVCIFQARSIYNEVGIGVLFPNRSRSSLLAGAFERVYTGGKNKQHERRVNRESRVVERGKRREVGDRGRRRQIYEARVKDRIE